MSTTGFWAVVWLIIAAVLVWPFIANPKSEKAWLKWMFGPTPRDYRFSAIFAVILFGGPLLTIFALKHYPPLDLRLLWVMTAFFLIVFVLLFWFWKSSSFPDWVGPIGRVAARGGLSLCLAALVLGVVVMANGYSTPLESRSAQVVRKERSRERDPSRRQYRLYVLAWPGSDRVTEVDTSEDVYDRVRVGDRVVLTLGVGRLGLEWVRDVH